MSDELSRRSMLAALGVAAVGALSTEALSDDSDDFTDMNGVRVYKKGKKPPTPKGLKADFEVISPFGFKVIERDGKPMWAVGSEQDYRASEAKRLGINAADVNVRPGSCYNTGPMTCSFGCSGTYFCKPVLNPKDQHYYCKCVEGP